MMNRMNRIVCLMLCWGVCILPFQTAVCAQAPTPRVKHIFEVTDASSFWNRLQATPAFRGWNTDEMKKFTTPIQAQISRTLDRAKTMFGLDIKALANLLSGRIIMQFDSADKVILLYCKPKNPVSIEKNIMLLKAAMNKAGKKFTATEKQDVRVLTVKDGEETFVILYSQKKVLLSFSAKDITDSLITRFIVRDIPDINSGPGFYSKYPELAGPGLKSNTDSELRFPPLPGVNLNEVLKAVNIPGMGRSASRLYIEKERLHSVSFLEQDMSRGLCGLLKKGSVSDEILSWAHESCRFAAGFHIDISRIPSVIQSAVHASGNQMAQNFYGAVISQIQLMVGFNVEKDLFAHLGDEMLLVSLPNSKAGGFPLFSFVGLNSLAAVIKLRDAEKFSQTADRIAAFLSNLARMDRVNGGLRTQDYKGTQIKYMRAFCGVLSPCFAIKDGYLVLTLNVPFMKHILDLRGGPKIIETRDFKDVSSISGDPLGSMFTYSRPLSEQDGNRADSFIAPLAGLWVAGALTGMLLPALNRARTTAKQVSCKNNLRQIGLAMSMYAVDQGDAFPPDLESLVPNQVYDKHIFHCSSSVKPGNSYTYLTGLTVKAPSDAIVVFDKEENHGFRGRNVLYVDAHVTWKSEQEFRKELQKMLTPAYKKHYNKQGIDIIRGILQAQPVSIGDRQKQPDADMRAAESQFNRITERNIQKFFIEEGKKIGSTVDFAIFPTLETFPSARRSNFTNVSVKVDGIYSRSHTGHIFGGGGAFSLMTAVAVIAIIAAIAVPNLIKSKISANEGAAAAGLKTFNGMMAVYRKSDYDQNGVRDYPVNLSALYYEMNRAGERVTLIGIADAQADYGSGGTYTANYTDRTTGRIKTVTETFTPQPKAGYWFSMIPLMHDGKPYAENRRNHYAICAFPADYGNSGQVTFIINEEGTVYSMDFGEGKPIKKWPGSDPIAEGWEIAQ